MENLLIPDVQTLQFMCQILMFPRVSVCQLCEFDVVLDGSWALLGGFGVGLEAPKQALGSSGGSSEKGVRPPGGSRGLPGSPKRRMGPVVIFTKVPETLCI